MFTRPAFEAGPAVDLRFCSRLCFTAWEAGMTLSETEIRAIEGMLPDMGKYVATAGIVDKPFSQCSRDEILALLANTIKIFRVSFQTELGDDIPF